jgi:hypothetical protein
VIQHLQLLHQQVAVEVEKVWMTQLVVIVLDMQVVLAVAVLAVAVLVLYTQVVLELLDKDSQAVLVTIQAVGILVVVEAEELVELVLICLEHQVLAILELVEMVVQV